VLAPKGTLTVTVYTDAMMDDAKLDAIFQHYNKQVVGPYWPAEREIVNEEYRSVSFPFERIPAPKLTLERQWTLAELAGYLRSWSATVRYVKAKGTDPVIEFEREMAEHWGDVQQRRMIRWPFVVMAGHV
jgi:hypothetical protein